MITDNCHWVKAGLVPYKVSPHFEIAIHVSAAHMMTCARSSSPSIIPSTSMTARLC
jgi:hypothetical protein